jgi:hypothetical protein
MDRCRVKDSEDDNDVIFNAEKNQERKPRQSSKSDVQVVESAREQFGELFYVIQTIIDDRAEASAQTL